MKTMRRVSIMIFQHVQHSRQQIFLGKQQQYEKQLLRDPSSISMGNITFRDSNTGSTCFDEFIEDEFIIKNQESTEKDAISSEEHISEVREDHVSEVREDSETFMIVDLPDDGFVDSKSSSTEYEPSYDDEIVVKPCRRSSRLKQKRKHG
jgi:hypothetical protein